MAVMSEGLLLNSKYIKMGREEGGFQAFLTQPPLVTQAAQAHYMNADMTLACQRCCVTNGYLQRFV